MTRPARAKKNSLVLDGNEIKVRLEAERTASGSVVHVDWLRFTCQLRNAPAPSVDDLFPKPKTTSIYDSAYAMAQIRQVLSMIPDEDFAPAAQALELGREVCQALGEEFSLHPELRKGHDFYKHRWSIVRNDQECGWVGFLASSDGPRQKAQARTLHVNLYGYACTFAAHGWNLRMAQLVDAHEADITRCDLALDFFDGYSGGMERIKTDYESGLCDSGGKRLKCNLVGDWCNGQARSFYIGSKEAGKQTNVYEKGDQLFGVEAGSAWMRFELRYGNKLRVLSSEMLRRPADFFAGASEWHALVLAQADQRALPEPVRCTPRRALETVEAEVYRNLKWFMNVAAPTVALAFHTLGDEFLQFVTGPRTPGRLKAFNTAEIRRACVAAFPKVSILQPVEGYAHAFA